MIFLLQYRKTYLELVLSYFSFQNHDIGQSKSNDTAITAYHREHNTSLSSDVQTLKIKEVEVKQEGEKYILEDFHFIAKPELRHLKTKPCILQPNHARVLSTVVDTYKISQELLSDIYGGKV